MTPQWRYACHYETTESRIHYIEVARDERHYGIEKHMIAKPSDVGSFKSYFMFEGCVYQTLERALQAKERTRNDQGSNQVPHD